MLIKIVTILELSLPIVTGLQSLYTVIKYQENPFCGQMSFLAKYLAFFS